MPRQPMPDTFTTESAARLTSTVSTAAGMGSAGGSEPGSRPAKTGEKLTPERIPSTLARKAGGRGAAWSSERSTTDRCICCAISWLGPREKLSPRNQHIVSTATTESAAPPIESVGGVNARAKDAAADRLSGGESNAGAE